MIVTGRHLPRRMFLKGMGAVIALPALDAMTPALAAASRGRVATSPLRLAFTYAPNGVTMADWTPSVVGTGFEYTRILKPLEAFRGGEVIFEAGDPADCMYVVSEGEVEISITGTASTCSGAYIPVHPVEMRASGDTHVISVMTRPAPPIARDPRWTK